MSKDRANCALDRPEINIRSIIILKFPLCVFFVWRTQLKKQQKLSEHSIMTNRISKRRINCLKYSEKSGLPFFNLKVLFQLWFFNVKENWMFEYEKRYRKSCNSCLHPKQLRINVSVFVNLNPVSEWVFVVKLSGKFIALSSSKLVEI